MPVADLTFDEAYFTGEGYGGYTDITSPALAGQWEGVGSDVAAKFLAKGFSLSGRRVLILGAGLGHILGHYLAAHNMNVWGIDISEYAVQNQITSGRVILGDARVEADIVAAKASAGLSSNQRWDAIVSEQLAPCLSDADLTAASRMWRSHASPVAGGVNWSGVIHMVHTHACADVNPRTGMVDDPYNTRTLAEWRAFFDGTRTGGQRPDWVWRWVDGAVG
jgi:hypothetical protein